MSSELISVIIPVYNSAAELPRCIDSVLAQDYPEIEIILIDDGSTDDTANLMGSIADDRLRYIQQKENRGAAHARNTGVEKAQAE